MALGKENFVEVIPNFLLEEIKKQLNNFVTVELEALKKRVDDQREIIIASAVVRMQSYVSTRSMSNELIITISKGEKLNS